MVSLFAFKGKILLMGLENTDKYKLYSFVWFDFGLRKLKNQI